MSTYPPIRKDPIMSYKSFARGLSYHAGAGIGEGVRALLGVGTVAAALAGADYLKRKAMERDIQNLLKKDKK